MTSLQFDEEAVFKAARRLPAGEARGAYLDQACGADAARRARLEDLLRADAEAGSFLAAPALAPAETVDQPVREGPGSVIGPYKLLEPIGEGGFGVVFLAEQTEPVRRKVALKVLKPGMDTKQVVARFEAERQALALMDHPNIARVFDGGATPEGRPYFVMELVRGVPVTDYCDQNHLDPRQRLELFLSVCAAVQHAHTKSIIHRDLKPSNVLVSRHDTVPVVKVIDFGVAKALGQGLTDKTLYTGLGQMVGTPLYMSPEQAGMSDLDVDTRSDIYSLGVLLYELLTGTTPFTKERFRTAAYDEIRRIIREEDPPKPSTRLSESTDSLPSVAASRQTEPAKLTRLVRGELDWIVMKALEKDRNRRYETASGLALDVQRYLAGEPVLAAPASPWYRARKFVRRHRGPVAAAGLVLLALVGGVAGTTWGLLRAEHQRQLAEEKKQEAFDERDAKAAALGAERQAREGEAKARRQAFAALRSMTADVIEKKFTQGAVLTEDDRAFLRNVIAQYDAFAAITGDDADSRALRAEGRWRVGTMRYRLGEVKAAEQDYDQARSLYQQLDADFPDRPEFRQRLALTHSNRGNLLRATGRPTEAETAFTDALALQKQLADRFPDRPEFRQDLAASHDNLGILLSDTGRSGEAEKAHRDALAIRKQLADGPLGRADFKRDLARGYGNLGVMFKVAYRFREAEAAYASALAIYKQLAAEAPNQTELRLELARSYDNLGALIQHTLRKDRLKEAETAHVAALAIFKRLAADFPARPQFRQDLAVSHNNLAALLARTGRPKEAEKAYLDALAIYKELAADFPDQPDLRSSLAGSFGNLAMLCNQSRGFEAAKAYLEEALPHSQAALRANARNPMYRQVFRNNMRALVAANAGLQDQAAALQAARQLRDLGWDPPGDAHYAAHALALCIPIVETDPQLDAAKRRAAVQFYGDEAMTMLRDAVGKGWKDAALVLANDPALAPLRRQRDDFKKLVAEVQATSKGRGNEPLPGHPGKD